MIRSQAVGIIARRLNLNAGRVAALAQRIAEAGLLPKARGRDIPSLGYGDLAKLLICSIADRGLGEAARSTEAYANLVAPNGAVIIDIAEGWISGAVPTSGVSYLVLQLEPEPAATIISHGGDHLNFGPERSRDAAARNVIIPGNSLAAICAEFRGATPDAADYATAVGRLAAALI